METNSATTVGHDHGGHAHHWEVSAAPLILVAGIFFMVPMAFSAWFVYSSPLLTAVFAGIGTPLTLWGVAKWVYEGLTEKPLVAGLAGIGLPIFIVSEIFIFLGLFATYWTMRLSADVWPPEGTPEIGWVLPVIMTVILVSSSITIHVAEEKFDHDDQAGFRKWLILSIALGTVFLGCTLWEYNHLAHMDFIPSTNAFSSAFFSITGFHASHVFVGLGAFVAVLIPAYKGLTNRTLLTSVSVYWHFVDIVWFFVVSQIYFW